MLQPQPKRTNEVGLQAEIYPATFNDLGDLVTLADEGLPLLPNFASMERDRSKIASSFSEMMSNQNKLFLIARVESVCVGAMACYLDQYWFSDRIYSENIFLYVIPRWRGSNIASTLLNVYKQWARVRGVDDICFDASSGIKPTKTRHFLEFHGFRHVGDKLVLEDKDGR